MVRRVRAATDERGGRSSDTCWFFEQHPSGSQSMAGMHGRGMLVRREEVKPARAEGKLEHPHHGRVDIRSKAIAAWKSHARKPAVKPRVWRLPFQPMKIENAACRLDARRVPVDPRFPGSRMPSRRDHRDGYHRMFPPLPVLIHVPGCR